MRLADFERAVQRVVPHFNIRQAGYGDVVGCFVGNDYLFRLNKGELALMTWTRKVRTGEMDYSRGIREGVPIVVKRIKRGRMQALFLLKNYRHITERQSQELMWGYPCQNSR